MVRILDRSVSAGGESSALFRAATLPLAQIQMDQALQAFGSGLSDYRSLLAMSVGGLAYQAGKTLAISMLPSVVAPFLGLVLETTAFRATHSLLSASSDRSPIGGSQWFSTALDLALMKGMGQATLRQSFLLRLGAQSSAVVLGQDLSSSLNLLPTHSGSHLQRFAEASVLGLEMGAGVYLMGLATGGFLPRLQARMEVQASRMQNIQASRSSARDIFVSASSEASTQKALGKNSGFASRSEILEIHRGLGFKKSFTRASLETLLQSLDEAQLSPRVNPARLRTLREVESFALRRHEFLKMLLMGVPRPNRLSTGRARFVDFDALKRETDRIAIADKLLPQAWAKDVFKAVQGATVLADVNFGRREAYLRVVDHHGIYAQERNATQELLDSFEAALRTVGGEGAFRSPSLTEIERAIRHLNIREISTDNLADGAWCVWIAQNQRRVLRSAELRTLIREATFFEDFSAFGNNYERGERGVRLQAALFKTYGDHLRARGLLGSDRFTTQHSAELMTSITDEITRLLKDETLRHERAMEFWLEVDTVREVAAQSVVLERTQAGRRLFAFYNTAALRQFSIFAQWLGVPDIQRSVPQADKLPLQATVAPMPVLRGLEGDLTRILPIVAIPHARRLPSGKDLLGVLTEVNAAEARKVQALKDQALLGSEVRPNFWFGRSNVILPNPAGGGTLLTSHEIAEILMQPKLGLFQEQN